MKRETVPSPNTPMINYEFSDILRSSCVSVWLIKPDRLVGHVMTPVQSCLMHGISTSVENHLWALFHVVHIHKR